MDAICDDLRGEVIRMQPENGYLMSMVSKEWNKYLMDRVRVVSYYKDFKMLCKRSDMLSLVRSYGNIHVNVCAYYVCAFASDIVMRFLIPKLENYGKQYLLMGACRGGNMERFIERLCDSVPNRFLLFYAAKGQNMEIIKMIMDIENFDINQGLYGACYVGNNELIDFFISVGGTYDEFTLTSAFLGNQEELAKKIILKESIDMKTIKDTIFNSCRLDRINYMLNFVGDESVMLEYAELIANCKSSIPIRMINELRKTESFVTLACRYGRYEWLEMFIGLYEWKIGHWSYELDMIKYLFDLNRIYIYETSMFYTYKNNDVELIYLVQELLKKKKKTLYL